MKAKKVKKPYLIIAIAIVCLIAVLAYVLYQRQFKYVTSYSDSSYLYKCSKPLRAKYQNVTFEGGVSKVYVPVSKTEATQYCKAVGIY